VGQAHNKEAKVKKMKVKEQEKGINMLLFLKKRENVVVKIHGGAQRRGGAPYKYPKK